MARKKPVKPEEPLFRRAERVARQKAAYTTGQEKFEWLIAVCLLNLAQKEPIKANGEAPPPGVKIIEAQDGPQGG